MSFLIYQEQNIQNLISEGYIKVDGNTVKTNYKLKESNVITIDYKET